MEPKKTTTFSPEVRERAIRMVIDPEGEHASRWAAICSIAAKIGCSGAMRRGWIRQGERDPGQQDGLTTEMRERIKAVERENRERRPANELLRKASASFAQAARDRRFQPGSR